MDIAQGVNKKAAELCRDIAPQVLSHIGREDFGSDERKAFLCS